MLESPFPGYKGSGMGCIFSVGPVVPEILGVQSKKNLFFDIFSTFFGNPLPVYDLDNPKVGQSLCPGYKGSGMWCIFSIVPVVSEILVCLMSKKLLFSRFFSIFRKTTHSLRLRP